MHIEHFNFYSNLSRNAYRMEIEQNAFESTQTYSNRMFLANCIAFGWLDFSVFGIPVLYTLPCWLSVNTWISILGCKVSWIPHRDGGVVVVVNQSFHLWSCPNVYQHKTMQWVRLANATNVRCIRMIVSFLVHFLPVSTLESVMTLAVIADKITLTYAY